MFTYKGMAIKNGVIIITNNKIKTNRVKHDPLDFSSRVSEFCPLEPLPLGIDTSIFRGGGAVYGGAVYGGALYDCGCGCDVGMLYL